MIGHSPWSSGYLILVAAAVALQGETNFRADSISLNGTWKFDLRHDNQLTQTGPVRFGPVSASSQAVMIAPAPGLTSEGRWHTSVPWPVSVTVLDSTLGENASSQIWKPHPAQQGPTWWQADFGASQSLAQVSVRWVKPGQAGILAETSDDGKAWRTWAQAEAKSGEPETRVAAPPQKGRHLRLTFSPTQFDGTRTISVWFSGSGGTLTPWAPRVQRVWYEELRKFTPQDTFHQSDFDDRAWKTIPVPSYWEVQKFSAPTWWQPDDTVGYYRRKFSVPDIWRNRSIRLRFEGVNNAAQIWINGKEVGYHESGFTQFEYDVGRYLRFGEENTVAIRVTKWTLTHEYDTDDVWFLGGIFRNVYLYSLPPQRIDDFTLKTELDSAYRDAVLKARVVLRTDEASHSFACEVEGSLVDASNREIPLDGFSARTTLAGRDPQYLELAAKVANPRKWTAETPYLYSLVLRFKVDGQIVQQVRHTIGFRQVEIRGASILLNGVPLKLRGVVTTRANPNDSGQDSAEVFAREIRILKQSNINALRSHTTPLEEEFLDLCDKHGIYILPDVPYVWVNEYDFRYLTEGAVLRAREVYEQHKNRTSVIIWHIGNENGLSSAFRGMGRAATWLHETDSTRPVTICSNRADPVEFGTEINDLHYHPMGQEQFRNPAKAPVLFGEFHALPEEVWRLKDRGFVETWGRSLNLEWAEFQKRPWVSGGLICCWDDGSVNGNIGPRQWGVVDSRRQPKDVAYHIRKVFAPVRLELEKARFEGDDLVADLAVTNRFDFTGLDGFRFAWLLTGSRGRIRSGLWNYRVRPGQTERFPLKLESAKGGEILSVEVFDPSGYSIQNERFPVAGQQAPSWLADIGAGRKLKPGAREVKTRRYRARWDAKTPLAVEDLRGTRLLSLADVIIQRAKSRAENVPAGAVRFEAPRIEGSALVAPFTVGDPTAITGALRFEFSETAIRATYEWTPSQDFTLRESGLLLTLPVSAGEISWNRSSLWSSSPEGWADGPQEKVPLRSLEATGSRRNINWLTFSIPSGFVGLAPSSGTANFRLAESARLVWSDYTGSGDFLGKFDRETVEEKMKAGQKHQGSLVIRIGENSRGR